MQSWGAFFGVPPVVWAMVLALPLAASGKDKSPAPDGDKVASTQKELLSLFDFKAARTPAQKIELAKKLKQVADESNEEVVARYVLLDEARNLAISGGEAPLALELVTSMAGEYQIDAIAMKAQTVKALAKTVRTPAQNKSLAVGVSQFLDASIAADQFALAKSLVQIGVLSARRGKDNALAAAITKRAAEIPALEKAHVHVKTARAKLKSDPKDPEANLQVGRYLVFIKRQWPEGLTMLAAGSDPGLKAAAIADLAEPAEAKAQHALGNQWWGVSEKLEGHAKQVVQNRAAHWYTKAQPALTGLNKIRVDARLKQVKPLASTTQTGGPGPDSTAVRTKGTLNLIGLLNPTTDFKPGDKWAIVGKTLKCTEGNFVPKAIFPYRPPKEYDVKFVYAQPRLRNGVGVILPHPDGGKTFAIGTGGRQGSELYWISSDNEHRKIFRGAIQPNKAYTVVIKIRKKSIEILINQKKMLAMKTDYSDLKIGPWHRTKETDRIAVFADDPATFNVIELTEISGPGQIIKASKADPTGNAASGEAVALHPLPTADPKRLNPSIPAIVKKRPPLQELIQGKWAGSGAAAGRTITFHDDGRMVIVEKATKATVGWVPMKPDGSSIRAKYGIGLYEDITRVSPGRWKVEVKRFAKIQAVWHLVRSKAD